ncbi:MAG TPA: glycoside hydrolase family 25 protein [Candidatus Mediterraneibacter ornithocaccae]|nr:glycoside hydrolase family 25 protein [Candidatus Mediterraneibacter ornithocaccae]
MSKLKSFVLLVITAFLMCGCEAEVEESSADGGEDIHTTEEGAYYTFQDVEENTYEAPLLSDVPKCTYDFEHLKTDETTGYKSFYDEENGVTARFGIDVSEFQGEEIDWKQVRDSGVEFVIIRLGYRAYGESGELVLDAMYEDNIKGALDAGLDVGVYFFSQAVSAAEAVEEADFVLEHLKPYEITGPVVYDTEEIKWDTARTDNNTKQEFTNYCKVFCDTVEHAGYDPMIYSNMKWMAFTLDMSELSGYDFWYADYHDVPQCPYDYKIWQYSEEGAVPGINANVDLNLWFQKGEKSNEME